MGKRLLLVLTGLFVAAISTFASVNAAPTAGQGLEISPPLLDLKADPGQALEAQIKVRNVTSDTLVVRAGYEDFIAGGEDGEPKILLNADEKSPYSLKDWLGTTPSLTLAPGQQETIKLAINVPGDASPGGHYGLVRFTGTPPELEDSGVALSASVGTLLLVNISGDTTEEAKILEIFTSKGDKKGSFFEYGPINITSRIQNTGNVHIQPKGTIQVTSMLGKKVQLSQFNTGNRNVLPSSIRKFEQTLDKKLMFGRYTVKTDVVYGADSKITSKSVSFWVIPYKLIILAILVVVGLVYLVKRYNRLIASKAVKSSSNAKNKRSSKKDK